LLDKKFKDVKPIFEEFNRLVKNLINEYDIDFDKNEISKYLDGSDIEGYVLRNIETGEIIKLVNKDKYTVEDFEKIFDEVDLGYICNVHLLFQGIVTAFFC